MAVILRFETNKVSYIRTGFTTVEVIPNNNYNDLFAKFVSAGANFSGAGCEDWTIEGVDFTERIISSITENGIDYTPADYTNFRFNIAGRNSPVINPTFVFECLNEKTSTFRFFTPELNTHTYTATEQTTIEIVNIFGSADTDYAFQINSDPSLTLEQIQSRTLANGDTLTITNNNSNFSDSVLLGKFTTATTIASPFSVDATLPNNDASNFGYIDTDFMIAFDRPVNISNISASGGGTLFYAVRTDTYLVENYTLFPYTSLTDLNNNIPVSGNYTIHIFVELNGNIGTVTIEGTYTDATIENEFIFDVNTNQQFRTLNDSLILDGVNDYVAINNGLSTLGNVLDYYWFDKSFTVSTFVKIRQVHPVSNFAFFYLFNSPTTGTPLSTDIVYSLACGGSRDLDRLWIFFQRANANNTNFTYQYKFFNIDIQLNKWHHIAWQYDATNYQTTGADIKIFFNGYELQDVNAESYTMNTPQTPHTERIDLQLARSSTTSSQGITTDYRFAENFADFALHDRLLTPQEIWHIYKNGTNTSSEYASKYPADVLNNMVLHYPFDNGQYSGLTVTDRTSESTANVIGQAGPDPDLQKIYLP